MYGRRLADGVVYTCSNQTELPSAFALGLDLNQRPRDYKSEVTLPCGTAMRIRLCGRRREGAWDVALPDMAAGNRVELLITDAVPNCGTPTCLSVNGWRRWASRRLGHLAQRPDVGAFGIEPNNQIVSSDRRIPRLRYAVRWSNYTVLTQCGQ